MKLQSSVIASVARSVAQTAAALLAVLALALGALCAAPSAAWAASDNIASGSSYSAIWYVKADGTLVIEPDNAKSCKLGSIDDFGDAPWNDVRDSITSVHSTGEVSFNVNAVGLFYDCENLESVSYDMWFFDYTEDFAGMFYLCSSLQSLDASEWSTSSAEDMSSMFYGCSSLVSLDVSGWDVSNVTKMSAMFSGCSSLESLDLSSWDTSSASSMGSMFNGCTGLERVTLGADFSFTGDGTTYCELPTPIDDDGTEGVWMNEDTGVTYDDPADIPSNTAATYVAVFNGEVAENSTTPSTDSSDSDDAVEEDDGLFNDVQDPDSWYFDEVYALADLGYITGYTTGSQAGNFGVGDQMTRAQFVTIIWRIACPDEYEAYDGVAESTSGLTDVADDKYYTAAINWAVENGVVTGYDNGEFGVNDSMTFQDMCLIIARYAGTDDGSYEAITYTEGSEVLAGFADGSSVSRYAEPGMVWCVQNGLVSGNDDGVSTPTLDPKEMVARERVAVVLYRALEEGVL